MGCSILVDLPAPLQKWVDSQVNSGVYANANDYVLDLIRQDKYQKEMLKIALTAAEESGISHRKVMDIIQDVKGRMHGG
ncbi:MAG: type II toxin-antitoxin system ParD family antitoxin [Magnetococcales bacterium]|nr:type II toxin-antitoxin system ParD family antitoxin [Magnetococcales bacterium]NGZ26134.1 type II toxin-antitoxin system ParD family antitoxin [Magnetococcales bacterium]